MKPKTMDPLEFIPNYLCDQDSGLRNVVVWFLNRVLLEEAFQQCGCTSYERMPVLQARRNGFKPCTLKTKYGDLVLNKPQYLEKPFESKIFENYSRVDRALRNVIAALPVSIIN